MLYFRLIEVKFMRNLFIAVCLYCYRLACAGKRIFLSINLTVNSDDLLFQLAGGLLCKEYAGYLLSAETLQARRDGDEEAVFSNNTNLI